MVLGVCQRVLHSPDDAEDAFQGTFLVLVRKAGSIAKPDLLGNWLYGVAYRTALEAKSGAAKRRAQERQVVAMPAADPTPDVMWADLRPALDEEVNRLPAKYRVPFVLCYLEGKTNEEAARLLGCPKGTVCSRLDWARERLRIRLTRLGLALSAGFFATLLSQPAAAAVVRPALLSSTVKAAMVAATGEAVTAGVVSAKAVALTEGVLKAMLLNKLKLATALLLASSVMAVEVFVYRIPGAEPATAENGPGDKQDVNGQPTRAAGQTEAKHQDGSKSPAGGAGGPAGTRSGRCHFGTGNP
jgi:RNA polymerase sigma factor (sigma-70 family)